MQRQKACLGIIISCCIVISPWVRAETFALKTGERLEGTVLRAMGKTISIRLDDKGMYQCPLSDLEWVSLIDRNGVPIQGTLEGWSEGTYILNTEQGMISIKDGQVLKKAVLPKLPKAAVTQHQPVM